MCSSDLVDVLQMAKEAPVLASARYTEVRVSASVGVGDDDESAPGYEIALEVTGGVLLCDGGVSGEQLNCSCHEYCSGH